MKKLKLYLDTSVISHLDQQDAPEKMSDTLKFWDKIKAGEYDIVLSDVDMRELNRCDEEKRKTLTVFLSQIEYISVETDVRADAIAHRFIELNILKQKNLDDCRLIFFRRR